MVQHFEIGIIGAGLAGCFALLKLLEHQQKDVVLFELGRPFAKRRRQLEGALGCLPCSDGKFYLTDVQQFDFIDGRSLRRVKNWAMKQLENAGPLKIITDTLPHSVTQKKLVDAGWNVQSNDYFQWKPEQIHIFSRCVYSVLDQHKPTMLFDTEVKDVIRTKAGFEVQTSAGNYTCKKLILAPGRSGWRWAADLFQQMGLTVDDTMAKIGVRFEIPANIVKDFNKSNLSMKKEGAEVSPWNWNGTIMPEDHADMIISCFRSNESRWNSEKVSFSYVRYLPGGVLQAERIAKLSYLLFNDRVSKEKNKIFLQDKSQLNVIPEYNWLKEAIEEFDKIIPDFSGKGSYHIPNILCHPPKVPLGGNLQTEDPNLILAGETANLGGLLGAAISGTLAAEGLV